MDENSEQPSATYQCTMPDGTVRESPTYWLAVDAPPEYVVAVQSATSRTWAVRGWFSQLETAERLEQNLKSYLPSDRVGLLTVDGYPEGE